MGGLDLQPLEAASQSTAARPQPSPPSFSSSVFKLVFNIVSIIVLPDPSSTSTTKEMTILLIHNLHNLQMLKHGSVQ